MLRAGKMVERAVVEGEAPAPTEAGVGDILRGERARQGLSIAEVVSATGVAETIIVGLEADRLGLADVGVRGYLRIYARSLGLDPEAVLRALPGGARPTPARRRRIGERPPAAVALLLGVTIMVVASAAVTVLLQMLAR